MLESAAELQKLLEDTQEECILLERKINDIRNRLQKICDHPVTEPYNWEHDNGYGRQTMISGKRCIYCWFVDIWNRGNFVNPRELSE